VAAAPKNMARFSSVPPCCAGAGGQRALPRLCGIDVPSCCRATSEPTRDQHLLRLSIGIERRLARIRERVGSSRTPCRPGESDAVLRCRVCSQRWCDRAVTRSRSRTRVLMKQAAPRFVCW
jgi:hypothetical protein